MKFFSFRHSLRFRLIAATILVEAVMLAILIFNSLRLVDAQLQRQWEADRNNIELLISNSVNVDLFERDYAAMESTLQGLLDNQLSVQPILYIEIFDQRNRLFLSAGKDPASFEHVHTRLEQASVDRPLILLKSKIHLAGIEIGTAQFLISLHDSLQFRQTLLKQGVSVAGLEILISLTLLFVIGLWLTRNLDTLSKATRSISKGQYKINLKLSGQDEISQLGQSLTSMSAVIQEHTYEMQQANQKKQQSLEKSQSEHARLQALLKSMQVGIVFENRQQTIDYFNQAFLIIWKLDEQAVNRDMLLADVMQQLSLQLQGPEQMAELVEEVKTADQDEHNFDLQTTGGRTIQLSVYPVQDDQQQFIGRLWIFEDITREKQTSEKLLFLAERDYLTGLYNRRRFQDELERRISSGTRQKTRFALLIFDLDEFKLINDNYGHQTGDAVLIRAASELSNQIRPDAFLSRLGGDEFALISPVDSAQDAETLAQRIIESVATLPLHFAGDQLRITTSIGIALFPQQGNNGEELIANADIAMYAAKQRGKNTYRTFAPDMLDTSKVNSHLTWNERIIDALEQDRFVLHFQEVQNIAQQRPAHYELLIRMIDKEQPEKLIMPGQFIPVAERSGKIMLIDQWVVRQAILLLAEHSHIPALAVNISGRSLDEPALAQLIQQLLQDSEVKPSRLIIELTETAAVSDLADAQRFIEQMHQLGCRVYLDDFGAGFSTFAYLKHIDADCLKFDGQFIVNLGSDHANQIFVKSMVTIAQGLGKKTVAEFVEDAETLSLLEEFGVDMAQGYFIHKPTADIPR